MKESALKKKMEMIEKKIRKKNLIEKSIKIARELGKGRIEMLSDHTKEDYTYEDGTFKIHYNDDWGQGVGGKIKIFFYNNLVLHGDRYALDKEENKYNPKVDGFCILTYIPSRIIAKKVFDEYFKIQIKNVQEQPKKSKKILKNPEVDKSIIDRLKNNFHF